MQKNKFKKYIVQAEQSVFDLGIQLYGDVDGVAWLCEDNSISATDELQIGSEILVRIDEVLNEKTLLALGSKVVSTGFSSEAGVFVPPTPDAPVCEPIEIKIDANTLVTTVTNGGVYYLPENYVKRTDGTIVATLVNGNEYTIATHQIKKPSGEVIATHEFNQDFVVSPVLIKDHEGTTLYELYPGEMITTYDYTQDLNLEIHPNNIGKITAVRQPIVDLGQVSGAVDLDLSLGNHFKLEMTGNISNLTLSNKPASTEALTIEVQITMGGAGDYTITYSSDWEITSSTDQPSGTVSDISEIWGLWNGTKMRAKL